MTCNHPPLGSQSSAGSAQIDRKRDAITRSLPTLDQAFFSVDAGTFAKFRELLDQPLPTNDKLRRLLKTKAPWEV